MSTGWTPGLAAVWGSSASDVFAVGQAGTILHYNGSTWRRMPSGTATGLKGVWGESTGEVFAVGSGGIVLHYSAAPDR